MVPGHVHVFSNQYIFEYIMSHPLIVFDLASVRLSSYFSKIKESFPWLENDVILNCIPNTGIEFEIRGKKLFVGQAKSLSQAYFKHLNCTDTFVHFKGTTLKINNPLFSSVGARKTPIF